MIKLFQCPEYEKLQKLMRTIFFEMANNNVYKRMNGNRENERCIQMDRIRLLHSGGKKKKEKRLSFK